MFRLAPVLLLLSVFISPASISAQRAVDIGGKVFYADSNRPAAGVTVSVLNIQLQTILSDVTSDTGDFRFSGLGGSQYVVSVQAQDYQNARVNVDLSFELSNGMLIYLQPVAGKAKPPVSKQPAISAHELSMPEKAREAYALGQKKLYQDKNAQASLADFQHALTLAPTYFESAYQLGVAYLTLGNLAEAETAFRKSINSSGDTYGPPDVRLGGILSDRSDFAESEKLIRKGISLDPNFWLGHYELGRALLNQNHLPEALAAAEEARRLAPKALLVYRLLSNIHRLQQNYPALLADLNAYIDLDPDSPAGIRAKQIRDQMQHDHPDQSRHFAAVRP